MVSLSYDYQKPNLTYTLDQYIACKSSDTMCYHNLSFVDVYNNIAYDTYNVLSDYVSEIKSEYCVQVILSDDEALKYMYRPKLLCFDIYGNTELAFIILIINDMCNVKEFVKKKLYMPRKADMSELIKYLINANSSAIATYNNKVSND